MPDVRTVLVPDGLEGTGRRRSRAPVRRVARTKAADLAADGHIALDGKTVAKSERLSAGPMLEVSLPRPRRARASRSSPSRCRAWRSCTTTTTSSSSTSRSGSPPTPASAGSARRRRGWLPPATASRPPGAPERQGVVSRLDVGTSGLMVVAKSESAYSRLKQAFRSSHPRQDLPRPRAGLPDPVAARSTRPSAATPVTTTSSPS